MTDSKSVTERSIIFTADEIRAHQAGRKSQVRRVIKSKLVYAQAAYKKGYGVGDVPYGEHRTEPTYLFWLNPEQEFPHPRMHRLSEIAEYCPYGIPGERLWVKETFRRYVGEGSLPDKGVLYKADGLKRTNHGAVRDWHNDEVWKPSTNMARWASRLLLEITDVSVEKLQDISINDILAEDVISLIPPTKEMPADMAIAYAREYYAEHWDSINAKRGHPWKSNPWVWVLNYKGV